MEDMREEILKILDMELILLNEKINSLNEIQLR